MYILPISIISFICGYMIAIYHIKPNRKSKNDIYFESLRDRFDGSIDSPEELLSFVEDNAIELYNLWKEKQLNIDGWITQDE